MRRLVPLIVLIFLISEAKAQDTKLANTLLWRISGNGLTKPSYLYGTMHVTDKRVFQLGDSLYKALEQTEGFAAELDMNRMGTQMMNQVINQEEEKNATEPPKVKEVVSAETWNQYKQQLEKKLNKKADKITVKDLDGIESRLQVDLFKKGDMPTFLDAWLSGQARKQGKWVGGIEDIEDQLEHIDDVESKIQMALFDDDYYRGSFDWFIKMYAGQRLDSIDAIMYREVNGKKDYILIKRNAKMARRMDSLSAIRSTLFAVGAAHLPGDSGVIALLRSRGFTVTPVISSKKINPDKYISKSVDIPWEDVSVPGNSYALKMPGTAGSVEMFESMGLDMKMYFDLSFMKLYMTMGIDIPESRKKIGADSLYAGLRETYASKGEVVKEKQVTINGMTGKEFRISTDEGEIKMQVFIPENVERIVLNMVFAFNEKTLSDAETEKFFQSFVFNKDYRKPTSKEKVWTLLQYPTQSFSVEMPLKPREKKDVISEEGKVMYEWQGIDIGEQIFYGISVSAMKEKMYDASTDSVYFESIKDLLSRTFEDSKVIDSAFITVDTYPAYKVSVTGKTDGTLHEARVLAVSRGGLSYYLYTVSGESDANRRASERFLNSFKLMPFKYPEWKTMSAGDNSFSTVAPFPIRYDEEEEEESHPGTRRYVVYDSLAHLTGFVDRSRLPDWFWYSSDTAFLRYRAKDYSSWEDSVMDYKLINVGKLKAAEFIVAKPGDNLLKKARIILNGDELYEVFGNFAKQDLPAKYNRFFENFKVTDEKPVWNRSQKNTKGLVAALQNPDKKAAAEVKQWWNTLEFNKDDIPELQKMMLRLYPDFDSTYYSSFNRLIFDKIEFIDSNNTSVAYIKNNYSLIQPSDEYVKGFVLSYLAGIRTAESYTVLKECFAGYPATIEKSPYFTYKLYDSLELTATLFPEMFKLANSESLWSQVSSVSVSLLDSNLLDKNELRENGKYFIERAKKELAKDKTEIEEGSYQYSDIIKLLGAIGTSESGVVLKRFTKFDAREIKFRTFIALLESNQQADNRTALTLGSTDEYRHVLYDELKRINKLKIFPANYLSQKELGRSKVYEYATDDEAEPGTILDAGERTILYKGKLQKFYLYKFSVIDEESGYLAVAGPYPVNLKDFTSTHDVTGVHWDTEFDEKNLDKLFKAYMDSLEGTDEINDDELPPPPKTPPPGVEIKKN